eukprot:1777364-Amphidinium_carterae.1
MRKRARSGKNPDDEKSLKEHIEDNEKLDYNLREEEERERGAIEEREDFKIAKYHRDSDAVQEIVYEYARG